jgi:hypothetical protein
MLSRMTTKHIDVIISEPVVAGFQLKYIIFQEYNIELGELGKMSEDGMLTTFIVNYLNLIFIAYSMLQQVNL